MIKHADSIYQQSYNIATNNCGDLVNQSLSAGNVQGANFLRRNPAGQPIRRAQHPQRMEDIFIKMTRAGLDIATWTLLSPFACLLQIGLIWRFPGYDFVASWNPALWTVWSGLVGFGSTIIVLAGWIGEYRWKWMIDLLVANLLAVVTVIVLVRIFKAGRRSYFSRCRCHAVRFSPGCNSESGAVCPHTLIDSGRNYG
jgi:hypothetical protein